MLVALIQREIKLLDGEAIKIGFEEKLYTTSEREMFIRLNPSVILSILHEGDAVLTLWGAVRGVYWRIGRLELNAQPGGLHMKMWPWTFSSRGQIMQALTVIDIPE